MAKSPVKHSFFNSSTTFLSSSWVTVWRFMTFFTCDSYLVGFQLTPLRNFLDFRFSFFKPWLLMSVPFMCEIRQGADFSLSSCFFQPPASLTNQKYLKWKADVRLWGLHRCDMAFTSRKNKERLYLATVCLSAVFFDLWVVTPKGFHSLIWEVMVTFQNLCKIGLGSNPVMVLYY